MPNGDATKPTNVRYEKRLKNQLFHFSQRQNAIEILSAFFTNSLQHFLLDQLTPNVATADKIFHRHYSLQFSYYIINTRPNF